MSIRRSRVFVRVIKKSLSQSLVKGFCLSVSVSLFFAHSSENFWGIFFVESRKTACFVLFFSFSWLRLFKICGYLLSLEKQNPP